MPEIPCPLCGSSDAYHSYECWQEKRGPTPVENAHQKLLALHRDEPAETLCGFHHEGGGTFAAQPMRPFLPCGLMLWNVPDGAIVQHFVGCDLQLQVAHSPQLAVPARWFTIAQSFADVVAQMDEGKHAAHWGTWSPVHPGVFVRLRFMHRDGTQLANELAEKLELLMWGQTLR
jgi:hypothetical protein